MYPKLGIFLRKAASHFLFHFRSALPFSFLVDVFCFDALPVLRRSRTSQKKFGTIPKIAEKIKRLF